MKKILTTVFAVFILVLATLVLVEGHNQELGASQAVNKSAELLSGEQRTPETLPRMVSIYSEWCAACRKMKPVVDKLTKACDGKGVHVERVDYENPKNEEYMESYEVEGLPTFLFIDEHGIEVERHVGAASEDKLTEMLSFIRGEDCSV